MGAAQGRNRLIRAVAADFAVLNPGGRDETRQYPAFAGSPADPGHAPVNYHAYAACVGGGFFRREKDVPSAVSTVLVLLRKNGLGDACRAVDALRRRGVRVFVSWKESGLHQVAAALSDGRRHERFRRLCREADGCLSSTPDLLPLYEAAGCRRAVYVPTPYPVDDPRWNFALPPEQRRGILIGTREFDVPSRNHLLAVSMASQWGEPVTVVNLDGRNGEGLLRSISPDLEIIGGRRAYSDYLRMMSRHRIVFQLDRSAVPGQVAGDALLCRIPCVGGDGAVEREAFPGLCSAGRSFPELSDIARRLLADTAAHEEAVAASQAAAAERLSFAAVRLRLLGL